jgi:hypothetical protein
LFDCVNYFHLGAADVSDNTIVVEPAFHFGNDSAHGADRCADYDEVGPDGGIGQLADGLIDRADFEPGLDRHPAATQAHHLSA